MDAYCTGSPSQGSLWLELQSLCPCGEIRLSSAGCSTSSPRRSAGQDRKRPIRTYPLQSYWCTSDLYLWFLQHGNVYLHLYIYIYVLHILCNHSLHVYKVIYYLTYSVSIPLHYLYVFAIYRTHNLYMTLLYGRELYKTLESISYVQTFECSEQDTIFQ